MAHTEGSAIEKIITIQYNTRQVVSLFLKLTSVVVESSRCVHPRKFVGRVADHKRSLSNATIADHNTLDHR